MGLCVQKKNSEWLSRSFGHHNDQRNDYNVSVKSLLCHRVLKTKTKNIKASSEFTFLLILASLRKLIQAKENNLILICDEITSGFRINGTGAYKKIGFKPDIVVYGKGLGNGFPITAIVAKKKIIALTELSPTK